jgi:Putative zinc-finger
VTCEEVRPLLAEHLLGALEPDADAQVRRHLRGCAACREERDALEQGLTVLSHASHDVEPPDELRPRVLDTLDTEWQEASVAQGPAAAATTTSRGKALLAAAAVALALVVSAALAWGASQARRADVATEDAASYRELLQTLGGEDFRVGALEAPRGLELSGQVLVYDGDPTGSWNSWAIVLVRAPGMHGTAKVRLEAGNGRSLTLRPLEFARDGDAATWLVTGADLSRYDRLTVSRPGGTVIATATIRTV